MIKYKNRCCGCAVPAYPCLGASCPNRNVPVHYCDECGSELDTVYKSNGAELCADCHKETEEE